MSKIAEKKALEEYPPENGTLYQRLGYVKGYDQAMQDFMEKAEEFFKSMYETMRKPNLGDKTIELFKNYMGI